MPFSRSDPRAQRLLDAMVSVGSDLSLPIVLRRIVESACSLVDARFGALGVIGPDRRLSEFITVGVDAETHEAIGHLPEGKGILGVLIVDPKPLRLRELSEDPRSYGFPPNHPPMHSFLGVPIRARDAVFGNLYLCEKQGAADFTEEDEQYAVALAAAAGVAVDNARLMQRVEEYAVLEDRERIARDLHDKIIQRLFATGMALQTTIPLAREEVADRLAYAVDELDETIRDIRNTIFQLHAPPRRGVRVELFATADAARDTLGFAPELHLDGPIDTVVSERLAEQLLSALQEMLSNVAKHAAATRVEVRVEARDSELVLLVADNGTGIEAAPQHGYGLRNLEQRATAVGGSLSARRANGGGTVIEWRVPLDR